MSDRFDHLISLMARLRAPDGCPWDRKQTHESLKPYLLEETYEVLDAIDRGDPSKLVEELGDLLLQVVFHAQIASEAQTFSMDEIAERLAAKLVRRHPHVFETKEPNGRPLEAEQVLHRWEDIKRRERQQTGRKESVLDGVPKTLPALLRAYQVQARASRIGFDWPHTPKGQEQVFDKVWEEVGELRSAAAEQTAELTDRQRQQRLEAEFGDVLFSLVNAARFLKINPEDALRRAVDRFSDRFHFIEQEAARMNRPLESLSLEEMDTLWASAKRHEANHEVP
jgi:tetrapyrrole methylase family protein/MazG family protein